MSIEVKDYIRTMIKSDYDLLMDELMPYDRLIFAEKHINGKTNKELGLTSKKLKDFNERIIKAIRLIKSHKLEGISETLLRYKCKNLGLDKNKTEFAIDCFVNNLTRKQMPDKYFIEPETVKKYKGKLRKELEQI